MPAPVIVKAVLEQRPVQVHDEIATRDGGTRRVVNPVESAAAQEKAEAIQDGLRRVGVGRPRPGRAAAGGLQPPFNCLVLRDYTADGAGVVAARAGGHVHPPPAPADRGRPDDRRTCGRVVPPGRRRQDRRDGDGRDGAAPPRPGHHAVRRGARTTCSSSSPGNGCSCTRRPASWPPRPRTWPGRQRRAFVATVATNDWDAVVMTRTAFERIPMSTAAQKAYLESEIDALRAMLATARGGRRLTVKRIERMIAAGEQRLTERLDGAKDDGVTFEATGIDYLIVDEAHEYKNLRTATNIPGAAHRRLDTRQRPAPETVLAAQPARAAGGHLRHRHPDRELGHRGPRDDPLPAPGPCSRRPGWPRSMCGRPRSGGPSPRSRWPPPAVAPTGRPPGSPGSPTSRRCCGCGTSSPTSAPPPTSNLPTPDLAPRASDGHRGPETIIVPPAPSLRGLLTGLGERADRVRVRAVDPERRQHAHDHHRRPPRRPRPASSRPAPPWRRSPNSTSSPTVSTPSGPPTATPPTTTPPPDTPRHTPGALQLVFCDLGTPATTEPATQTRRHGAGTPTPNSGTSSSPAASPRADPVHPRRHAPTPTRPACSPPPAPGTSRS